MFAVSRNTCTCGAVVFGVASLLWESAWAELQPLTEKCMRKVERFALQYQNDGDGRLIYISASACNYREAVGAGLFDGVHSTATGLTDLAKGRGQTEGVTVGEKNGDNYRVRWSGACFSSGAKTGSDVIRCSGVWAFIEGSGSGKFAGVKGGGSWNMLPLADGTIDTEATGYYER